MLSVVVEILRILRFSAILVQQAVPELVLVFRRFKTYFTQNNIH